MEKIPLSSITLIEKLDELYSSNISTLDLNLNTNEYESNKNMFKRLGQRELIDALKNILENQKLEV
jgi:hypothetical protein